MFERYTENARRAIYFARTEALARDSAEIATKDIVLGLTCKFYEEQSPFAMLNSRQEELRALMGMKPIGKMPEAKDIPLSRDSKLALAYAAEEVNRDRQFSLEPHHLLRGIVRTGDATAVAVISLGWDLETLRTLSAKNRKLYPPKRPPLRRVLQRYRKIILQIAIPLILLAALIFYLRWQQR
jgi:hypothetical protein